MQFNKTVSGIIIQIYKSIDDFLECDNLNCHKFLVTNMEVVLQLITQTQNWVLNET